MSGTGERKRQILHIDMNAFYCSCHSAAEPDRYQGKATAVAGSPETRHGVVVTASYEARRRGVRATMTTAEALRACPDLLLIHPDFDLYREFSRQVFNTVRQYTPQLEVFSIDECWADITGSHQFGSPLEIATELQQRLMAELGLPCSIGIAPNKFLAKMASDFKKPFGITLLDTAALPTLLWPLPVDQMFGVGKKSAERLNRLGLSTIGELAQADAAKLARWFGKRGVEWIELANGRDESDVQSEPEPLKSVGHSITLSRDSSDQEELSTVLLNLSDQVGRRVRRHKLMGRTVQITIRYANRETITRAKTLAQPTDITEHIYRTARELLFRHRRSDRSVRLLGVTLGQLQQPGQTQYEQTVQLDLFGTVEPDQPFTDTDRLSKLTEATDRLRDKYGENIVVRGRMLEPHESSQIRDRKIRGTSLQKDNIQ